MAKSVDALLDEIRLLGESQAAIVNAVRTLVEKTVTPVTEEVKYGGILFSSGVQFCGVFAYREHVSVELATVRRSRGWHTCWKAVARGVGTSSCRPSRILQRRNSRSCCRWR